MSVLEACMGRLSVLIQNGDAGPFAVLVGRDAIMAIHEEMGQAPPTDETLSRTGEIGRVVVGSQQVPIIYVQGWHDDLITVVDADD